MNEESFDSISPNKQMVLESLRIAHPSKAPREIYGQYTKVDNHDPDGAHWVKNIEREVELDELSVTAAIEALKEASEDLSQAHIDHDLWSDERALIKVCGQRLVTAEELQWIEVGIAAFHQRRRDQAAYVACPRCQVKHLPPAHPMLEILKDR